VWVDDVEKVRVIDLARARPASDEGREADLKALDSAIVRLYEDVEAAQETEVPPKPQPLTDEVEPLPWESPPFCDSPQPVPMAVPATSSHLSMCV
jgi:hypothetical protein